MGTLSRQSLQAMDTTIVIFRIESHFRISFLSVVCQPLETKLLLQFLLLLLLLMLIQLGDTATADNATS